MVNDKLNILVSEKHIISACDKMKKNQMFRNFLWFPIISLTLFNATFKIEDKNYHIPQSHYIILAVLVILFLGTYLFDKHS
jgi:hypothetical protein